MNPVLRMLRDAGPQRRASLGDVLDLSRSRLAAELDRLVARGLVDVGGRDTARGGRSSIVRLAAGVRFLGVDVGPGTVRTAVTDGELNLLAYRCEPMDPRGGPKAVLRRVVASVDLIKADRAAVRLAGAGVGLPGGAGLRMEWRRFPMREALATELGCPVLVDNEANVMALGEKHAGIARTVDDFLFVAVGAGIGCGVVARGQVYRGANGCAGDIGHICVSVDGPACACGNSGCLDAYLGDRLAWPAALGRSDVLDAASRIGEVLVGLVCFVNPALVVVGGRVTGLGPVLLAGIRGAVHSRSAPLAAGRPPIVLSELGDRAGVVGAARLASDHAFSVS